MKALTSVITAISLLFIGAGNAVAAFHTGATPSLGLSVWNNDTGIEIGYDLGTIGLDLDLSAPNQTIATIDVSDTASTVALYSTTSSPTYINYFGIMLDTEPEASFANTAAFGNTVNSIFNSGYANGDSPIQVSTTAPKCASYLWKETGSYGGFVVADGYMPSLESLAADGYVDIFLYRYDPDPANRVQILNRGSDVSTPYTAVIRIESNGTVILNPLPGNHDPEIDSISTDPDTEVSVGDAITLNATIRDKEKNTLSYSWKWSMDGATYNDVDGGNGSTGDGDDTETGVEIQVPFTIPIVDEGSQISFELNLEDGEGGETSMVTSSVNVVPAGGNSAPIGLSVAFTPAPSVNAGVAVTMTGSATDPDGDSLGYAWTNVDGMPGFPADANTAAVTFTAPTVMEQTVYHFTLSVSDNTNEPVVKSDITLTVNPAGGNSPPTGLSVAFTPAPSVNAGVVVTMTGSATDPDGDSLDYAWTNVDGMPGFPVDANTAAVTFTAPTVMEQTVYHFTLSVSDGNTDPVTKSDVTLTVNPAASTDPTANAGGTQFVQAGDTVTLDGSGSSAAEGHQVATYQWVRSAQDDTQVVIVPDENDPGKATFEVPVGTSNFKSFTFILNVTDDAGASDEDSCKIWVVPAGYHTGLMINAWGVPEEVYENDTDPVNLFAMTSNTIVGVKYSYAWNQIGGSVAINLANDKSLHASFNVPNDIITTENYIFRFQVSDPTGFSRYTDVTITVRKNMPPGDITHSLAEDDFWKQIDEANDVWESKTFSPTLAANNATEDPDGDEATYEFEVCKDTACGEFECGALGVSEGDAITSWQVACQLEENTYYYWRARANDQNGNHGGWMNPVRIFINAENSAPTEPVINWPVETNVDTDTPELKLNNATDVDDPDGRVQLQYEFWVYSDGNAIIAKSGTVEANTSGITGWKVKGPDDKTVLAENQTYWWRARAIDAEGATSAWTDPAQFLVDLSDEAPEVPTIIYPEKGGQISELNPVLEIEGGLDPEGEPVIFNIALDTTPSFNNDDLIQSGDLVENTWQVLQELKDNTKYFYKVNASDGTYTSAWGGDTDDDWFFVNLENDPPAKPTPVNTNDEENPLLITTLTPTLEATPADPVDVDLLDTVSYDFELFLAGNLTEPLLEVTSLEMPLWQPVVSNGKKYAWHVRAVDNHGLAGGWTALSWFTTGANNYQPSKPITVNPFNGGTVNTLTPTLCAVATDDDDHLDIWIEFELYGDSGLTDLISYGLVIRGTTATSWPVDVTLVDQTQYYWRARSTDGEKHSAWTSINSFTVDLSGQNASTVQILKVVNYDPALPWYTVVEVDDSESDIYGTTMVIPPGALATNNTLYIGTATSVPSFSDGLVPLGKVIEFGPSDITFNVPVIIKMPYSNEDLEKAGGISPQEINVYTYNETIGAWEPITVTQVDEEAKVLVCEVEHFSLYSTAAGVDSGTNTPSPVGGGGGGCFVGSAGSSLSLGVMGMIMAAMLVISLAVINESRKR